MRRDMVVQMKISFPPCCDESYFLLIRVKVIWKSSFAVLTGFSTSTWGFALNEKSHGGLFSLP
jgi:hypothetical protein